MPRGPRCRTSTRARTGRRRSSGTRAPRRARCSATWKPHVRQRNEPAPASVPARYVCTSPPRPAGFRIHAGVRFADGAPSFPSAVLVILLRACEVVVFVTVGTKIRNSGHWCPVEHGPARAARGNRAAQPRIRHGMKNTSLMRKTRARGAVEERHAPELERQLLRTSVLGMTADRCACSGCGRSPLVGERIQVFAARHGRERRSATSARRRGGRRAAADGARLRRRPHARVGAPHRRSPPARYRCRRDAPPVTSRNVTIDAPREQVFDYLADIANHAEFSDHYLKDFRLERARVARLGAAASFRIAFGRSLWGESVDHGARAAVPDRARRARPAGSGA